MRRRWRACCRRWAAAGRFPPTATAPTERSATCSSGSRRPARWSSASTTSTGPTRPPSTSSPPSSTAHPPARSSSRSRPAPASSHRRSRRARALRLGPLNEAEARELVGATADAVYGDSGGNPFYLEQLARGRDAGPAGRRRERPAGGSGPLGAAILGPAAVAAALAAELRGLAPDARRLLDAAAVIGDPFGPALAAETAELDEPAALAALDELLERALVRPGGAPRRFAFRHPVVRHAVYEATPGGWRLGAHARAAVALERRGAGPVERAHHVEQAASRGDEAAIALLAAAARELQSPAPATAARFHAAALRLLPDGAAERTAIEARLADAQAAAGDAAGARETLLGALRTAAPADRLALTVAVANAEWWLGRTPDARRRLQVALGELPAQPSPDRIRLRLALALTALMSCDLHEARDQAADAAADARAIGDPVFEAAALAAGAVARASDGEGLEPVEAAAAVLERLAPSSSPRASPRSGCSAARGGGWVSSSARSPTSSAARRSRSRPAATTSACS